MWLKYLTLCLNMSPPCLTWLTFSQSFNSQCLPQIRFLSHPKRKPRKQDEPTSGAMTKTSYLSNNRGHYTKPPAHVKIFVHPLTHAPTCVYAPFPNPLNLIEGPALERAARGGPLQLSTRTPSPPSTSPHWIKFVKARPCRFPLDFLP